jgi:hypothetical protein
LLPEFETPPAPKRQKKSKQRGAIIADLETVEEDDEEETPEPSGSVIYQTSQDSSSKTSTPSEGSDHGGDATSAPQPPPMRFTEEQHFTHATQDEHHGSRQGRSSSQDVLYSTRKGKKPIGRELQGQGASEDSGYNPNFIPHRKNWLMKKKKMQEEWAHQERLRMQLESDVQSGGGAYAQSYESDQHSHASYGSTGSYQVPEIPGYTPMAMIYANTDTHAQYVAQYEAYYQQYMSWPDYLALMSAQQNVRFE